MSNPVAFLLSLGYVALVLTIAEGVRAWLKLPGDFTRKFVHIAIGTWIWPTFHLFTDVRWAVVLPALFIGINFASYKLKFFAAIEESETGNLGTILFPVSFVILLLAFWDADQRAPAMIGLFVLAWGDAFAAIIGRRFGRLKYRVFGEERSLEGSFAMYLFSFLATMTVLFLELPGQPLLDRTIAATVIAVGSTLLEAVALRGTDNLLIPLGAAAMAFYLL